MIFDTKIRFLNKHDTKRNQFKYHTHDCYEILYLSQGKGKLVINGKSHPISADCYCIIPPNTEHNEELEEYSEIFFIGFECSNLDVLLQEKIYNNVKIANRFYFDAIFKEYKTQEFRFKEAADCLLSLFLLTLHRTSNSDNVKCKDLHYIKAYIEQYAEQKINFSEFASLSGYSYDYFRHVFKQKFGISPQEYLISVRIGNAQRLLLNTNLSCTEIAYRCGFSNGAQMTDMFKKKLKTTPNNFRKSRLM